MRRKPLAPSSSKTARSSQADDVSPLTPAQLRELKRRLRDLQDRTRFLLVSAFTDRTAFYYDVSQDTWGMNDPSLGSVFKRRTAASAVQHLLRDGVRIIRCRVDRHNHVIKKSVPRVRGAWPRRRRSKKGHGVRVRSAQ